MSTTTTRRRRAAGSVRFDPYFKVQKWRMDVGGAWVDIQARFDTAEEAKRSVDDPGRYRLMFVDMTGRRPADVWDV